MKAPRSSKTAASISSPDVTEALLAQILIHLMDASSAGQKKKALALRNAGLSNAAIATLMGTSPEVIGSVIYQARRKGTARSTRKKAVKRRRPAR
jgi:hypothetical protein